MRRLACHGRIHTVAASRQVSDGSLITSFVDNRTVLQTILQFLDGCVRQKDSYTEKHHSKELKSKGPEIRLKLYFMVRNSLFIEKRA